VIVDNIGLSGLMIPEGQTDRTFFLTAAKWMTDTTRLIHLKTEGHGGITTLPVILHIKRPEAIVENQSP